MKYGNIKSITEIHDFECGNIFAPEGSGNARLGFMQMVSSLAGGHNMDGYEVVTEKSTIRILIDNEQSCCESWGYMSSDDELEYYYGATLNDVELTDTKLERMKIEDDYYDEGGVQFVTFKTDKGDFQLAVYNGHNGYYGHGILVAVDDKIIHQDTI